MSAHYDRVAADEQIRHAQIARYNECERREEEAAETAILALVEIDGSELLQMCADDPALDARLVILMERIAMMGTPANNSHYHDDALRVGRQQPFDGVRRQRASGRPKTSSRSTARAPPRTTMVHAPPGLRSGATWWRSPGPCPRTSPRGRCRRSCPSRPCPPRR